MKRFSNIIPSASRLALLGAAFTTVFLCACSIAVCQHNVLDSDPLSARKLIVYDQVGGYGGLSLNTQGGIIVTDCNCEFTGGAGTGFTIGALFERLTRSRLIWGVSLGYENRSIEGRFREIEGVVQRSPTSGTEYTVPLEFSNIANVNLGYLTAIPYLKYTAFNLVFAKAGASLSYVVSSNLKHTKVLMSDTVRFPNGESASVSLPDGDGSNSYVLQDGPIKDLSGFQLGIVLGGGFDIRPSKSLYLSPVIQYVIPVTSISSSVGNFSSRALQLLVECRFIL